MTTETITPAELAAHKAAHDSAFESVKAGGSKDAYNAHLATYLESLRKTVVEPAPAREDDAPTTPGVRVARRRR